TADIQYGGNKWIRDELDIATVQQSAQISCSRYTERAHEQRHRFTEDEQERRKHAKQQVADHVPGKTLMRHMCKRTCKSGSSSDDPKKPENVTELRPVSIFSAGYHKSDRV